MNTGMRFLIVSGAVVISLALLCLGCQYTSLDTADPDVPPLRETYHPQPQLMQQERAAAPIAERAVDAAHVKAAHAWLVKQMNEIIEVDDELLAGEKAAQEWKDKQGPESNWSGDMKQFYADGQELASDLKLEREMLVKEYNAEAERFDPAAFLSDDSEPLPRKM